MEKWNITPEPNTKIAEYIQRVRNGESLESFGDIPDSWKAQIRDGLGPKNTHSVETKNAVSLEALSEKLHALDSTYFFLTHQTGDATAKQINTEGFRLQAGGLNTTTLFQGADSIIASLEKMNAGESHRGVDGMIIFAVPKDAFAQYAGAVRFSPDAFADMLIDTQIDAVSQKGDLRIPTQYNLGTYSTQEGFVFNAPYA